MLEVPEVPRPAWQKSLPNMLTMGRVVAIPVLGASSCSATALEHRVPALIFLAIAFTDWLDGFLARRWSVQARARRRAWKVLGV